MMAVTVAREPPARDPIIERGILPDHDQDMHRRIETRTAANEEVSQMRRLTQWIQPVPLLAVILWGGIYPGAKVGLRDIPPVSFTAGRLVLATAILLAVSWRSRTKSDKRLDRRIWWPMLNAGIAQAAFQGLLVAGLDRTTASNSAILQATAPLLMVIFFVASGGDHLVRRQWSGLLIGLAGVALVVGGSGLSLDSRYLTGNMLEFAAAAAWGWYSLAVGPVVRAVGTLRATGWSMALATVFIIPFAQSEMRHVAWSNVSWEAWSGLVYGATAGMVVAMSLWGRSIHRLGPRQTMLYTYIEPCSAAVVAALVLGETLTLSEGVGAALAFAGIWLASARAETSPEAEQQLATMTDG
jgi:drug/metabolite transporter (DMT)-like permease